MESIAGLPQNDYLGLKVLFDKYGRKAFEEENELNIYSRIGKKVLGCSHNKLFIDYIEKNITLAELQERINSRCGHDGISGVKTAAKN